jgi:hypothetical protein
LFLHLLWRIIRRHHRHFAPFVFSHTAAIIGALAVLPFSPNTIRTCYGVSIGVIVFIVCAQTHLYVVIIIIRIRILNIAIRPI